MSDESEPSGPRPEGREGDEPDDLPGAGEPTAEERAEEAEEELEERDAFKRRVAVVLALLAVLGGWIGILRVDAATSESYYARETTRVAVQSLRANVNQSTVEGLELDLDAEQQSLALAGPFRGDGTGFSSLGTDPQTPVEVDADLDEASSTIDDQQREELARAQSFEAERLDLRREALAETRVTYNNRASQYETVLTTLGVALFLVGFTLVLGRKTRPPIFVPGVLLAAYVVGWALWIHQRDIPKTSEVAIEEAAAGASHLAFGEPEEALDRYDRAVELDDDFVAAWGGRSYAAWQAANPDFVRTLAVVSTEGELADQARADANTAVELGDGTDFQALVLSGAYRFYDGDFAEALDRFEAAIEVNGQAPEAFALTAASQLALGDLEAASDSLAEMSDLLDTSEASSQTRQVAADLFSFLEVVERAVPDQAEAVERVRDELAAAEARLTFDDPDLAPQVPDGATVTVDELSLDGDQLTLVLDHADLPEGTEVSAYLYEQPAEGADLVQAAELARFAVVEGSGTVAGSTTIDRACTPVAFRLDVYLDGAYHDSFDAEGGQPTC